MNNFASSLSVGSSRSSIYNNLSFYTLHKKSLLNCLQCLTAQKSRIKRSDAMEKQTPTKKKREKERELWKEKATATVDDDFFFCVHRAPFCVYPSNRWDYLNWIDANLHLHKAIWCCILFQPAKSPFKSCCFRLFFFSPHFPFFFCLLI